MAAYRESLAIAERLAATDPSNADWQRDLSFAQARVGGALQTQGQMEEAAVAINLAVVTAERLATTDHGVVMYREMLEREIRRVQEGLDPLGVIRDPNHPMIETSLEWRVRVLRAGIESADPRRRARKQE